MVEGLLLQDGTRLFDLPHERRFLALPRVDWQVTLEAAETKTHREIHSLWGVFATTHRIVLLHLILFFSGVCAVAGDAEPLDGQQPLLGISGGVRFAAVALVVAFIDCEDKGITAELDLVHPKQKRRYYSSLIDGACEDLPTGLKKAKFRVELPGGDSLSKRIVGFPEHITSDIGSIGDFAASAEVAFGTILQRTYAVLGARMHYGHPDIMNKLFMMQQGGVSKATKTVNLSEDIFAGALNKDIPRTLNMFPKSFATRMDFTLRGNGRTIKHSEYFHLAKARCELQLFVSWSMPLLVFVWLLVLLADEVRDGIFEAFLNLEQVQMTSAEVMAKTVGVWFSWLLLLFLIATLMFIFQAKIIGHYVINEIRYGGATYVSTGRGLPTDRRPFIGEAVPGKFQLKRLGGLYLDYASIAYYET
eukprot:g33594.t1